MQATQELGSIDAAATNETFQCAPGQVHQLPEGRDDARRVPGGRREVLPPDRRRTGATLGLPRGRRRSAIATPRSACSTSCRARAGRSPKGARPRCRQSSSLRRRRRAPPGDWRSDKVAAVLAAEGDDALKCKAGTRGVYKVTAYVEPGGQPPRRGLGRAKGKTHKGHAAAVHGKVVAVGVAPPNRDGGGEGRLHRRRRSRTEDAEPRQVCGEGHVLALGNPTPWPPAPQAGRGT